MLSAAVVAAAVAARDAHFVPSRLVVCQHEEFIMKSRELMEDVEANANKYGFVITPPITVTGNMPHLINGESLWKKLWNSMFNLQCADEIRVDLVHLRPLAI